MPDTSTPIYIDQGSDWSQGVIYLANGVPVPLAGYIIECEIRTAPVDAGGVLLATPDYTIDDPANGHFILQMSAAETETIIVKTYTPFIKAKFWYDLYVVSPSGSKTRILNGPVWVSPRVTQ